jgi:hypothetical protein
MKICMNCQNRYLGCHSQCEKYKLEKEKIEQAKIRKNEYYSSYSTIFNLSISGR